MVMKAAMQKSKTRTIPAGEFKAKCLRLMDEVAETGTAIIITKRGKPVVRVAREEFAQKPLPSLYGLTKGSMVIHGDIVSPLPNEWEADQD